MAAPEELLGDLRELRHVFQPVRLVVDAVEIGLEAGRAGGDLLTSSRGSTNVVQLVRRGANPSERLRRLLELQRIAGVRDPRATTCGPIETEKRRIASYDFWSRNDEPALTITTPPFAKMARIWSSVTAEGRQPSATKRHQPGTSRTRLSSGVPCPGGGPRSTPAEALVQAEEARPRVGAVCVSVMSAAVRPEASEFAARLDRLQPDRDLTLWLDTATEFGHEIPVRQKAVRLQYA